jgi:thiamine-phosphate pyrophosphorylase
MKKKLRPLYGIAGTGSIPRGKFLHRVERAILGGVSVFQLREKNKSKKEIIEIAKEVKKICSAYNTVFIINDNPYIAKEVDADGVHLGRDDFDVKTAREVLGEDSIIGVSCYDSFERAEDAQKNGADYVSFSSPFKSPTKPYKPLTPWDVIEKAVEDLEIPVYVIGGINRDNIDEVLKRKAFGVCVISCIFNSEDPFFPAFELKEKILKNKGKN